MKEIEAIKKALAESGKIHAELLGKVGYSLKSRANLLTKADLLSQKKAVETIKKRFPSHKIVAEEMEEENYSAESLWIIDPLDGTTNYAHSFPVFSVSIAFLKRGKVMLGGIYDSSREEMFLAVSGKGATLNGKRISVSKTRAISDSLLATGFAYDRAEKAEFYCSHFSRFMKISHDIRRTGAASIDMAWLACGRTDGYWEFNLKPWDVAAGRIIVEEAGGKVSDFRGEKWAEIKNWGKETLASNGIIHDEMLKILSEGTAAGRSPETDSARKTARD